MVIDGKTYNESAAMMRYLCTKYDALKKFYPDELEQRYEIEYFLDFNGTVLRPTIFPPLGAVVGKLLMKKDDITDA